MIGTRTCRACQGSMAVAGSVGHLRCPHCACWMPTSESWTVPVTVALALGLAALVLVPLLRG